ncbi:MAG: hypothetical protein ACOC44_20555 [Promethearchaeia archaeon]
MTKNKIIIDTGPLLEYFKLIIKAHYKRLTTSKKNRLIQFLELFKGKTLIIVPQIMAEIYSLLKRDVNDSKSQLQNWLEILENPHLMNLLENYIQKGDILKDNKYREFGFADIALLKSLNEQSFLLTLDFSLVQYCRHQGFEAYHLEELFF